MPASRDWLGALLVSILLAALLVWAQHRHESKTFVAKRIAHAGGGLGDVTYSNSYQALDASLARGFEYFELDFLFTSDDEVICLHDWGPAFERSFGFATERSLTLAEFEHLAAENERFTNCTLHGLADWMSEHPSAHVVTDVRGDNLKALRLIRAAISDSTHRVIPQIYQPGSFHSVKQLGFEQIIWTLYRYQGEDTGIIVRAQTWPPAVAVAMPTARTRNGLPSNLAARGIPTYVYTINSQEERDHYIKQVGITEIYTDFLTP